MIKINDRFYIKADTNNYTLAEKTTIQDEGSKNFGQEIFKDLGYYTTLESCLKGLITVETRQFISKETINEIKDLKAKIKEIKDFVEKLNLKI